MSDNLTDSPSSDSPTNQTPSDLTVITLPDIQPIPSERPNKTAHNFTGSQLVLDPVTGYLDSPQMYSGFSVQKKLLAIKLAHDLWPNLTAIAKGVGCDRASIYNHLAVDAKFKKDMQEAAEGKLDGIEGYMSERAMQPNGYMDRITLLRAYRGSRFNPERNVNVTHTVTDSEAGQRASRLGDVIDAELVNRDELV